MVTDMVWIMDFKSKPWWKAFAIWSWRILCSSRKWQWNKSTFLHRLESHKDSREILSVEVHQFRPWIWCIQIWALTRPPPWWQTQTDSNQNPSCLNSAVPLRELAAISQWQWVSFVRFVKVMLEVRLVNSPRLRQDSFMKPRVQLWSNFLMCYISWHYICIKSVL